jgi:UrcA family protein
MTTGLALAAAVLTMALPAAAGQVKVTDRKVGSVTVSYEPRELASEAGAREVLRRLERAAYDACGGDPRRNPSWRTSADLTRRAYTQCREAAVARAVADLRSPKVKAVYAGRARWPNWARPFTPGAMVEAQHAGRDSTGLDGQAPSNRAARGAK